MMDKKKTRCWGQKILIWRSKNKLQHTNAYAYRIERSRKKQNAVQFESFLRFVCMHESSLYSNYNNDNDNNNN